jgi:PKD repeat protein
MRLGWSLLMAAALAFVASCQRNEAPAPVPAASPTPAIVVAPKPLVTVARTSGSPRPATSPGEAAEDAADDDDDIDKPWGPEFEIDADANWYYGFPPMDVTFTAKALNGAPPFTYVWDFADGSPTATGETTQHQYAKTGRYQAFVIGSDGNGEKSRVDFVILVVTPEEFAQRKGIDVSNLIRTSPMPTP